MPFMIEFMAVFLFKSTYMNNDSNNVDFDDFVSVMAYASNHFYDYENRYYKKALSFGIDDEFLCSGGESYLVDLEVATFKLGVAFEGIPISIHDTIRKEFSFSYGRADIVIFHIDGTVTVIEAKDGKQGYGHVVSGIGQVTLYATQLANKKVNIKKVRRCLLWSTTGDKKLDDIIIESCKSADVIPMLRKSTKETRAHGCISIKVGKEMMNALDDAYNNIDYAFYEFMRDLLIDKGLVKETNDSP